LPNVFCFDDEERLLPEKDVIDGNQKENDPAGMPKIPETSHHQVDDDHDQRKCDFDGFDAKQSRHDGNQKKHEQALVPNACRKSYHQINEQTDQGRCRDQPFSKIISKHIALQISLLLSRYYFTTFSSESIIISR